MTRTRVTFWASTELVEAFRARCTHVEESQSEIMRALIQGWLAVEDGHFVVMRLDIAEFLVDLFESMGNGAGQEAEAAQKNAQEVSDAQTG